MIPKPGKPPNELTSYRLISLLPIISKLFEKLLLTRIRTPIIDDKVIPDHQFGFRNGHSTVEQTNRVFNAISNAIETKNTAPQSSSIFNRHSTKFGMTTFQNKTKTTTVLPSAKILPKRKMLPRPVLYTLFTADVPIRRDIVAATFAEDTATHAVHQNLRNASKNLQRELREIEDWLDTWRIKVSETESVQVTFATKRGDCTKVKLHGHPLPTANDVKYLGMHLDRRQTWTKHIRTK
ncbi:hypothetical protein KPH14_012697 [Odynerus spinipes]|uniref:Reverse transcriptase domain-containing protein n=1 Tax=Odynerus spinipes TaxID=1348599 RepID=A0AAD9RDM9_9HYME|nr:hypothetical protein KPH14_012697 [Odynerus spinipes]